MLLSGAVALSSFLKNIFINPVPRKDMVGVFKGTPFSLLSLFNFLFVLFGGGQCLELQFRCRERC